MLRFTALIVATALALAAPAPGLARGGYIHLPPKIVRAGPPIPMPELGPVQILGGCGPKRSRDPATGRCRGPADVGN